MNHAPPKPLTVVQGIALGIVLPLALFLASLPLTLLRDRELSRLPGEVEITAPSQCVVTEVRASTQNGEQAHCIRFDAPARTPLPVYTCSTPGSAEENWVTSVELDIPQNGAACGLSLAVFDSWNRDIKPSDLPWTYTHVRPCYQDKNKIVCAIEGRPFRTYAVVPVTKDKQFAGRPALVAFSTAYGLSIRSGPVLWFLGLCALVTSALALIYRFRPYGPRSLRWLERARWRASTALGASGGALTGLLFAVRPPDLGGRDEMASIDWIVALVVGTALLTALVGCILDVARGWLAAGKRTSTVLPVLFVLLLFVTIIPLRASRSLGAVSLPILPAPWPVYKHMFYGYFGMSLASPLLFCYEFNAPWPRGDSAIAISRTGSKVAFLFIAGMSLGLLSCLIGIEVSNALDVFNPGRLVTGFYKPGGTTVGLLLSCAPALAALALAVNVRDQRPLWVQQLDAHLSSLEGGGVDAALSLRLCLRLLLDHEWEIKRNARYLGRAGLLLGPMSASLTRPDIEQMDIGPDADESAARIRRVLTMLQRITPPTMTAEAPLLLVNRGANSLVVGKLNVVIMHYAGPTKVAVCQSGILLPPRDPRFLGVQGILHRVLEKLGPLGDGSFPFAQSLVHVNFHCDAPQPIVGESYELPLALLLLSLASDIEPSFPSWMASGSVSGSLGSIRADWVSVKERALSPDRCVLITSAAAVEELESAPYSEPRRWTVTDGSPRDVEDLVKEVKRHVRGGGRALIGVRTLAQAEAVLFGAPR